MPDPGLKLLIFLPAAGVTLLSAMIFMAYARQHGLPPRRAARIGLGVAAMTLLACIAIGLLILYLMA